MPRPLPRALFLASGSPGAPFKGKVCIPKRYIIPRPVLRQCFQRLDSVHSPSRPGELHPSLIVAALRRFDESFGLQRREEERVEVVQQLERTGDHTRVWWNADGLYEAFAVRLHLSERILFAVDVADHSSVFSCAISVGLVLTILLSIIVWTVGTVPGFGQIPCSNCPPRPQPWMRMLDDICVCIFTMEYLTRLVTASSVRNELIKPQFLLDLIAARGDVEPIPTGGVKFWAFLSAPSSIVDLLSVLPYWIELVADSLVDTHDLAWLRLFRLLRLSRVFKLLRLLSWNLGSLGEASYLLVRVSRQALPACGMLAGLVATALIVFSSLIFIAERGDWYPAPALDKVGLMNGTSAQQGEFVRDNGRVLEVSPFGSIPSASWWTIVTLTTVGYGDVYPATVCGKLVASLAILYGAVLLGLPVGIIGAQFEKDFSQLTALSSKRNQAKHKREILCTAELTASSTDRTPTSLTKLALPCDGCCHRCGADQEAVAISVEVDNKEVSSETLLVRLSRYNALARCKAQNLQVGEATSARTQGLASCERDHLCQARHAFEDTLRLHGASVGISEEQRQAWVQDLLATHFCAGPALDRLGARVLTRLSEEEKAYPSSAAVLLRIRQAWHELCILCCRVAESLAEDGGIDGGAPVSSERHCVRER